MPVTDPAVVEWIERTAGGTVVELTQVAGGGRSGFAVDVAAGDVDRRLFLQRGGRGGVGSFMGFAREAEVYRALEPLGIPIPHVWGVDEDLDVFLVDRAEGQVWFRPPRDPDVAVAVAQDFMRHLATWHATPARKLELPSFGSVRSVRDHQRDQLAGIEALFEREDRAQPIDLLARAQLEYLVERVPDYDDEPVVVQGDTGPGNFMFDGDRLVAVTDWELAHWGDVHDDLAWVLVRDTLERFPDLEARLSDYERASGFTIDPARLRYFRVLAQCRSTIGTLAGLRSRDARGEIAWQLIFNTLHTRLLAEALAEAEGLAPDPPLATEPDDGERSWAYDVALDDLRDVVLPALADDFAATRAKGVARLLKYLREADRLGPGFAAVERDELGALLGQPVDDVEPGRRALCAAIEHGTTTAGAVLPYCLRQSARDTAVARGAMGSLADRHFTPVRQLHEEGP